MSVLVAISTCAKYELDGKNQAFRDTCLKDAAQFTDVTVKFFIGDGTPVTEDSTALQQSFDQNWQAWMSRFPASSSVWEKKDVPPAPLPRGFTAKDDTVLLQIPDDYKHMSYKTRESLRWASTRNFDFIFRCCVDTYIDFPRLMSSGFEQADYIAGGVLLAQKESCSVCDRCTSDRLGRRSLGRRHLEQKWDLCKSRSALREFSAAPSAQQ